MRVRKERLLLEEQELALNERKFQLELERRDRDLGGSRQLSVSEGQNQFKHSFAAAAGGQFAFLRGDEGQDGDPGLGATKTSAERIRNPIKVEDRVSLSSASSLAHDFQRVERELKSRGIVTASSAWREVRHLLKGLGLSLYNQMDNKKNPPQTEREYAELFSRWIKKCYEE